MAITAGPTVTLNAFAEKPTGVNFTAAGTEGAFPLIRQFSGESQFEATATSTAADAITFDFPAATAAGLGLVAGQSRSIRVRVQGSGAAAASCAFAEQESVVFSNAGTLNAAGASSTVRTAGLTFGAGPALTVNAGALRVTLTGAAVTTNWRVQIFVGETGAPGQ